MSELDEIRTRHEAGERAGAAEDREWLLGEIERLNGQRDAARAEVERLTKERDEVLGQVDAVLAAVEAAGLAVVEAEDGR